MWKSLKDSHGGFDGDDQLRDYIYKNVLNNPDDFKQAGADSSAAWAQGFNEAFSKNDRLASLPPPDMTASIGGRPAGGMDFKEFGEFAQNFSLTPLAEDLSNID